ncbi:small regulatory polypeptide of amino acid response isoform X1 [Elephas maximus indicus]|uniref:small regulatory polypeptide of amino acid response isoform X1 n=2 Tax=Elephas maximus indicus TaxID=99487 RepID=UPI002116418B|nr:small regulatory polypeptide of amino acid response isoform X1 [Elephas maximus indicus]XP_049752625.1 small regulatory polypeptide of amino acid response isoform X1 [Elephas maximus indicus]XP_049752626.1 small regulatory polypeptide of amino acid response isoform X1 [Elephas maximus indicus]XP_049752627.1 small regulatory polypeptide of amino acid response isoform X1 [Elephas maximus indicus]XP_049752628.1 small regulatory polypeptide of amino acid response isoform X1 [Elephas maximus indi
MAAPSTGVVSIQDHWDEHLQLGKGFQLPDVPRDAGTRSSSSLEETIVVPVNQQEMMHSSHKFFRGNQGQQPLRSHVSLLFLTTDLTNLTYDIAMHMVTIFPAHLPSLSPEVLRHLEVQVIKWMHFQRWGLPRHVEESLRQLMPYTPLTFTKDDNLNACVETIGTISHKTWGPCMLNQPTQAFWLFKWSIRDQEQSCHCQKTPNPLALALPSLVLKVLSGLYPQPERQAEDSGDPLKQEHSQLFCGFSCLTSESLVVTYIEFQGISTNRGIPPFPLNVPFFFNACSFLPLLHNNPPQSASHSSTSTPNSVSPTDHQGGQINIPFWALAKFKVLEWNLLQRQLQVRRELPAVFERSQYVQTVMQYKPCDTAQSPETVETSWSSKTVSVLMRELPFFPDPAQRLLEFHLQKQLIHHHWGLSQRIKRSTGLLLSPADQQPLSSSSTALDDVNVPWFVPPEVSGVSDLISVTLAPVSDSMPHLLTKTKAILQSHIDSECCHILQGTVLAHIFISRDCGIPGSMEVAQFHRIPENKLLELQAATAPELYQKVMPSQTSPGAVIEHTKLSRSLPEGAMEKLGTNFQDKHLAFLSGLPALYHLAPSKATGPAITSQSAVAELMPDKPVEITQEPLTEMISYEEQRISPRPGLQDDETRADGAQEFLTEVQEEETKEMVHLESQTNAAIPKALKTSILTKLNFHLRKKVLDIQLGIPIKAREPRNQSVAVSENVATQEVLGTLNNQGKTSLQELRIPPDSPHAPVPELVHLKEQLIIELSTGQQKKKQASSRAGPHGSAHQVSKISQLSGDMTDTQVLCVQLEARVNSSSLQEAWCPESQGPGKTKDSAQVPTLVEKKEYPGNLKPLGDPGARNAGFGLPSTRKNRHSAEDQKPAAISVNRRSRGPWRRSQSSDIIASCQQSPKYCPQFKLPKLPPGAPGGKDFEENDVQDRETKVNLIREPANTPGTEQPLVPQASQGRSSLGPLIQGKPLQDKTLWNETSQERVRLAHTEKNPGLPESGLRNKMKCIFHCINSKTVDEESMFSSEGKATKTQKENLKKGLAPAKGPVRQAKTEKITEDPKTQSFPTEKEVSLAFSDGLEAPDNHLWHYSRHLRSGSMLGHLHCCFGTVLERLVPPKQGTHHTSQPSLQRKTLLSSRRRPSSLK